MAILYGLTANQISALNQGTFCSWWSVGSRHKPMHVKYLMNLGFYPKHASLEHPSSSFKGLDFTKRNFIMTVSTTTYYLHHRASPYVLKPQFCKNCFWWHIVRLSCVWSYWWNPSVRPLWLNQRQHINGLKEKPTSTICLMIQGCSLQISFTRWRFFSHQIDIQKLFIFQIILSQAILISTCQWRPSGVESSLEESLAPHLTLHSPFPFKMSS